MTWPQLRGTSLPVRPWLVTNDLPLLRVTALEGLGITLLPMHLVFEDLAAKTLVRVLPEDIGAKVDIIALFLPERAKSPVLRAFFANIARYTADRVAPRRSPTRRVFGAFILNNSGMSARATRRFMCLVETLRRAGSAGGRGPGGE